MQTLRQSSPVARKAHRCDWCYGTIQPGEKYHRSTNIYDDRLYDWVSCVACADLAPLVWEWAGRPDEGMAEDSFEEWAREHQGDPQQGFPACAYLIRRGLPITRDLPPDALLCPGDGCPGCFHCTSTNQGDDSDRATEPGRLVEPSNTASISRMEGATGAVGAPSPAAEVGAPDGRVGRGRAREVTHDLPPGEQR